MEEMIHLAPKLCVHTLWVSSFGRELTKLSLVMDKITTVSSKKETTVSGREIPLLRLNICLVMISLFREGRIIPDVLY